MCFLVSLETCIAGVEKAFQNNKTAQKDITLYFFTHPSPSPHSAVSVPIHCTPPFLIPVPESYACSLPSCCYGRRHRTATAAVASSATANLCRVLLPSRTRRSLAEEKTG